MASLAVAASRLLPAAGALAATPDKVPNIVCPELSSEPCEVNHDHIGEGGPKRAAD
jgi:hypothetical protein